MIKVFCDGCGKQLKDESLAWANAFLKEMVRQDNIFCEVCSEHSGGYWEEKQDLLNKIQHEAASRVENHLRGYYAKTRKKVLEVVK